MAADDLTPMRTCAELMAATRPGKQSIQREHRRLLPDISHSTDFEEAAASLQVSNSLKRWDYLICGGRPHKWIAFEVHQADASALMAKKQDSISILQEHCPGMLEAIKGWHVCAKGDISPSALRRLADQGIRITRKLIHTL